MARPSRDRAALRRRRRSRPQDRRGNSWLARPRARRHRALLRAERMQLPGALVRMGQPDLGTIPPVIRIVRNEGDARIYEGDPGRRRRLTALPFNLIPSPWLAEERAARATRVPREGALRSLTQRSPSGRRFAQLHRGVFLSLRCPVEKDRGLGQTISVRLGLSFYLCALRA